MQNVSNGIYLLPTPPLPIYWNLQSNAPGSAPGRATNIDVINFLTSENRVRIEKKLLEWARFLLTDQVYIQTDQPGQTRW